MVGLVAFRRPLNMLQFDLRGLLVLMELCDRVDFYVCSQSGSTVFLEDNEPVSNTPFTRRLAAIPGR